MLYHVKKNYTPFLPDETDTHSYYHPYILCSCAPLYELLFIQATLDGFSQNISKVKAVSSKLKNVFENCMCMQMTIKVRALMILCNLRICFFSFASKFRNLFEFCTKTEKRKYMKRKYKKKWRNFETHSRLGIARKRVAC